MSGGSHSHNNSSSKDWSLNGIGAVPAILAMLSCSREIIACWMGAGPETHFHPPSEPSRLHLGQVTCHYGHLNRDVPFFNEQCLTFNSSPRGRITFFCHWCICIVTGGRNLILPGSSMFSPQHHGLLGRDEVVYNPFFSLEPYYNGMWSPWAPLSLSMEYGTFSPKPYHNGQWSPHALLNLSALPHKGFGLYLSSEIRFCNIIHGLHPM